MKIEGTAYWSFLNKKNEMAGKYTLDVGQLNKDTIKELEKAGLNVRTKEVKEGQPDRGHFITLKGKFPPRLVDSAMNPMNRDVIIGNGSQVRVSGEPYSGTNKFGDYTVFSWKTVQIIDLVEYAGNSDDEINAVEGGYVAGTMSRASEVDSEVDQELSDRGFGDSPIP
jgi:hypothetical protein|tara:strand:+ start:106 stop:609 length:504 start_codon:yes stop_codon:yes gene_type:complete